MGEEIDERAGGRFYGIAVGIDSVQGRFPGPRREERGLSNKVALPRPDVAHHSLLTEI